MDKRDRAPSTIAEMDGLIETRFPRTKLAAFSRLPWWVETILGFQFLSEGASRWRGDGLTPPLLEENESLVRRMESLILAA